MPNQSAVKAVVVEGGAVNQSAAPLRLAFFNEDGTPLKLSGLADELNATLEEFPDQAEAQADSEATTIKELVADFNELLAKLRDSGVLAS